MTACIIEMANAHEADLTRLGYDLPKDMSRLGEKIGSALVSICPVLLFTNVDGMVRPDYVEQSSKTNTKTVTASIQKVDLSGDLGRITINSEEEGTIELVWFERIDNKIIRKTWTSSNGTVYRFQYKKRVVYDPRTGQNRPINMITTVDLN